MSQDLFVVVVKIEYQKCPVRAKPVGVFAPDSIIELFIQDRSTRKVIESGVTKISLSVGGGRNVHLGAENTMKKYMEEIKPVLNEKYGTDYQLELKAVTPPEVIAMTIR